MNNSQSFLLVRRFRTLSIVLLLSLVFACTSSKKTGNNSPEPYIPVSQALYDTIFHLDSLLFDAYNHCQLDKFQEYISEDIEFYHDKGGLMNSKQDIIDATRKNICGKVNRELVAGSLEVYPIHDYGAVEIGYHRFHNLAENSISKPDKFIHIWKRGKGNWQLTRIISLH